jgi:hypothetical protein
MEQAAGKMEHMSEEETLALHCGGGHFVDNLEQMSGISTLEAQDREIASSMLLGEGLNPNGEPLFAEDGSLTSLMEESPLPTTVISQQPLKKLGTQGNGYSTGKVKISALASFDKSTAASKGAGLRNDVTIPRFAACKQHTVLGFR